MTRSLSNPQPFLPLNQCLKFGPLSHATCSSQVSSSSAFTFFSWTIWLVSLIMYGHASSLSSWWSSQHSGRVFYDWEHDCPCQMFSMEQLRMKLKPWTTTIQHLTVQSTTWSWLYWWAAGSHTQSVNWTLSYHGSPATSLHRSSTCLWHICSCAGSLHSSSRFTSTGVWLAASISHGYTWDYSLWLRQPHSIKSEIVRLHLLFRRFSQNRCSPQLRRWPNGHTAYSMLAN